MYVDEDKKMKTNLDLVHCLGNPLQQSSTNKSSPTTLICKLFLFFTASDHDRTNLDHKLHKNVLFLIQKEIHFRYKYCP